MGNKYTKPVFVATQIKICLYFDEDVCNYLNKQQGVFKASNGISIGYEYFGTPGFGNGSSLDNVLSIDHTFKGKKRCLNENFTNFHGYLKNRTKIEEALSELNRDFNDKNSQAKSPRAFNLWKIF